MGSDAARPDLMQRPRLIDVNQRFVVLPARAVTDTQISHRAFRTLALLAINADQMGHCTRTVEDIEPLNPEAARDAKLLEHRSIIERITSTQHRIIYHPRTEDEQVGVKHKEVEIDLASIVKPVVRQRKANYQMPADGQTEAVKRIRKGVKKVQDGQATSKRSEATSKRIEATSNAEDTSTALVTSIHDTTRTDMVQENTGYLVTEAIRIVRQMYESEKIYKDEAALRLEAERMVAEGWTPPSSGS